MMAQSTNYKLLCFIISVSFTLIIFVSSTHVTPPDSGVINKEVWEEENLRKMVLGSRPPGCMNKCMNCRPCEATLVIPPHKDGINKYVFHKSSSHREDDSYYLLSWKCRCGNRIYQP